MDNANNTPNINDWKLCRLNSVLDSQWGCCWSISNESFQRAFHNAIVKQHMVGSSSSSFECWIMQRKQRCCFNSIPFCVLSQVSRSVEAIDFFILFSVFLLDFHLPTKIDLLTLYFLMYLALNTTTNKRQQNSSWHFLTIIFLRQFLSSVSAFSFSFFASHREARPIENSNYSPEN